MHKTAFIEGVYRYSLTREWDASLPVLYWVMLNPSTADAMNDDATIKKCIGFARLNGYGAIMVVNLFAYRATDPIELTSTPSDVVGALNNGVIESIPVGADVVCAWGSFIHTKPSLRYRGREVMRIIKGRNLLCVRRTEDRPWHPLYVKYGAFLDFNDVLKEE